MRSVPSGSFERLSSLESLWYAWLRCRRGKRRRPSMAAFDLDADNHLIRLYRALRGGAYRPSPYHLSLVRDPKLRLIAAPAISDRVLQNALLADIGPTYERGFIDQSYACRTGRGPHRAVLQYLGWTRDYRYRLTLDIHHYFATVRHDILYALFEHRLRDARTLKLITQLLEAGGQVYQSPLALETFEMTGDRPPPGCGLSLGGYLSHWSGGLYLDGLDHYVKRTLKIAAYQRYMDDFTLFGNDRVLLEEAREAIREWLRQERQLELNPRRQRVQPTAQPSTYLGFRVSQAGLSPGPKAKRRLKRRLREAEARGVKGLKGLVRGLRAYRGVLLTIG
jgi:hypothetical protein